MQIDFTKLSKDELSLVQVGKLCPLCKKTNVKDVGFVADLIRCNIFYNCQEKDCGAKWEGYDV